MLEDALNKLLRGWSRVAILCVGNPLRRDDGVGVYVADLLKKASLRNVLLLDAEQAPESFLDKVLLFNPSHLVIVDAVQMDCRPGDVAITSLDNLLDEMPLSTHRLPVRLMINYLNLMGFKGKTLMVGVQPGDLSVGEGLTPKVKKSADMLVKVLITILSFRELKENRLSHSL